MFFRLVHREVDNATLSSIEEQIAKEKAKLAKMAASGSVLAERKGSHSADIETATAMETTSSTETQQSEPMETEEPKPKVFSSASEPVAKREVSTDKTESSMSEGARSKDPTRSKKGEAQSAGIHISAPGSNEHLPPEIRAVSVWGHPVTIDYASVI